MGWQVVWSESPRVCLGLLDTAVGLILVPGKGCLPEASALDHFARGAAGKAGKRPRSWRQIRVQGLEAGTPPSRPSFHFLAKRERSPPKASAQPIATALAAIPGWVVGGRRLRIPLCPGSVPAPSLYVQRTHGCCRYGLCEHECGEASEPKETEMHLEPQCSALRAEKAFEDNQAPRY